MSNFKEILQGLLTQRAAQATAEAESKEHFEAQQKEQQISLEQEFLAEAESLYLSTQENLLPLIEDARDALSSMGTDLKVFRPSPILTVNPLGYAEKVKYRKTNMGIARIEISGSNETIFDWPELQTPTDAEPSVPHDQYFKHLHSYVYVWPNPRLKIEFRWDSYQKSHPPHSEFDPGWVSTEYKRGIIIIVEKQGGKAVLIFSKVREGSPTVSFGKTVPLENMSAVENTLTNLLTSLI